MLLPKKEDYTFYQGNKLLVEFYYTKTGVMPATTPLFFVSFLGVEKSS